MDKNKDSQNQPTRPSSLLPRKFFGTNWAPMWEDFEDRIGRWLGTRDTGVTVSDDDKNVYVEANLPGLQANDIDVSLDRNTLRISGMKKTEEKDQERNYYSRAQRSFFYQVELPASVEENTEQADYTDGVLHVTFKKNSKENVKKINIKSNKVK